MDSSLPVFWRVLSWWLLFQAWSTLRFDDHRGIVPEDFLDRIGWQIISVQGYVSLAFVHQKDWLATGWDLLLKEAPYARDYLLPAPANNYRWFKRRELTYHTAFAVQSRIAVYGFSEHLQAITTRPTAAAILCRLQQRFLGSARLTGICWEVGPPRAVKDTPGQQSSR